MGLDIWFKEDLASIIAGVRQAMLLALEQSATDPTLARIYRCGIEDTIATLVTALSLPGAVVFGDRRLDAPSLMQVALPWTRALGPGTQRRKLARFDETSGGRRDIE